MEYLQKHLSIKMNPEESFPNAKTAIVFLQPYLPHPKKVAHEFSELKIAAYAQGEDYHDWFQRKLSLLTEQLQQLFPNENFWVATDSKPVLERDLAERAGLGWIGKNTCLLNREKGSFFFIGEIISTLDLKAPTHTTKNFCGTCTKCIDACPTQALLFPYELDARRCISYLTIEAKKNPAKELRGLMQDWFFGCDICQTVCPWNQKKLKTQPAPHPNEAEIEIQLRDLLNLSYGAIERKIKGTALERARGRGLKRNTLVVIANKRLKNLAGDVRACLNNKDLGELAQWTLEQLENT